MVPQCDRPVVASMQSRAFLTFSLVLALCTDGVVYSANILALMGIVSPSHHIWNGVLLHTLAQRGHNLTILSVDLPRAHETVPPNAHYIHLEKAYDIYKVENAATKLDITEYIGLSPFASIPKFYDFGLKTVQLIYESQGIQQLLAYPRDFRFDLIIYDSTLGGFLLGFAHHFNYPTIAAISAFHNPPATIDFMSNHYFPAYTPYHSTTYSPRMSFWERFHNTAVFAADTLYRRLYYNPRVDELVRPHFGGDMPLVTDLAKLTSIAMVNSHPAIDYVEPLAPNVIEIGGMQIQEPKPLPAELDIFMRGGRKGAIFFSMGTNMKSRDLSPDRIQIILQAFGNLTDYNFLWKFDQEYLRGQILPPNVMIKPFFPQRDILAHPKMRAFVTHCGGMSSQEATWRGVPMVGIPLFFDQHRNLRQSLLAGCAKKVDYLTMTAKLLASSIKHVAADPQMVANAKRRSRYFRDNPLKPLDKAVWWIEYLLREPNPSHLKSPAAELNFFQAHSLDVLLVWVLAIILSVMLMGKILTSVVQWRDIQMPHHSRRHRKSD